MVTLLVVASTGCGGRERKAERLYRTATQAVEDGRYDEAVELLDRIALDYPETETAAKAKEDVKLYRGIVEADKYFPTRQARDHMILTARALDRYRWRQGSYPERLVQLVPRFLDEPLTDSWGREFYYEKKGRGYVLACLGSDGERGGEGAAEDILIENGRFVLRGSAP